MKNRWKRNSKKSVKLNAGVFFFEKINRSDKPLATLINNNNNNKKKQKGEKTLVNKIRNEKREVTTDNI